MQINNLNAEIKICRSNRNASIFRVYPDFPIRVFKPGQYGSLGLFVNSKSKLVKRAYSISSSIIDIETGELFNQKDLNYLEFYINQVPPNKKNILQITPKLFSLVDGDRIFCGEKIVGHYILQNLQNLESILLISTHTGESPNNAIVNQLLFDKSKVKICNINVGKSSWETLYAPEHVFLEKLYHNYKFIQFSDNTDNYGELSHFVNNLLHDESFAINNVGFSLNQKSNLVMLCGDPLMIGAPIKKGGFNIETPDYGLINIFAKKSYELTTRFKRGNIVYESYW